MQIVLAILALSFLIIVHEFGHFIVAKLSGIKVLEFSLFMGPKLFSMQRGETLYSLRAVPLGGYVKMEGEEQTSDDSRAYNKKPVHIRAAVIAAGPIANLIIAIIIFSAVFSMTGFRTMNMEVEEGSPAYVAGVRTGDKMISYDNKKVYQPIDVLSFMYVAKGKPAEVEIQRGNDKVKTTVAPEIIPENRYILGFISNKAYGKDSNIVKDVQAGSPVDKGGLKPGDVIIKLNDKDISTKKEISEYTNANKSNPLKITVIRNSSTVELENIVPLMEKQPEQYDLGVGFKAGQGGIGEVIKQALIYTYSTARSVYYSLVWLVTRTVSLSQMMGPVGIVTTIGDVVQQSPDFLSKLIGLLNITAFISVNVGVFNLIPFPALDGSKILLLIIEGIRKRAIPPEKEAYISMVGLALLIMLMIFATSNDIMRAFKGG